MPDQVFKKIELVGTSQTTLEDAIQAAVGKASKTLRNLRWFEVDEIRGQIEDGKVGQWQVTLKIGFKIDD